MGRNAGSTAEEVIAAGKGILAVGGKVTGWELKKALDGIGRPDRFESIWQAHLQENAPPPEPEPELDWPSGRRRGMPGARRYSTGWRWPRTTS